MCHTWTFHYSQCDHTTEEVYHCARWLEEQRTLADAILQKQKKSSNVWTKLRRVLTGRSCKLTREDREAGPLCIPCLEARRKAVQKLHRIQSWREYEPMGLPSGSSSQESQREAPLIGGHIELLAELPVDEDHRAVQYQRKREAVLIAPGAASLLDILAAPDTKVNSSDSDAFWSEEHRLHGGSIPGPDHCVDCFKVMLRVYPHGITFVPPPGLQESVHTGVDSLNELLRCPEEEEDGDDDDDAFSEASSESVPIFLEVARRDYCKELSSSRYKYVREPLQPKEVPRISVDLGSAWEVEPF